MQNPGLFAGDKSLPHPLPTDCQSTTSLAHDKVDSRTRLPPRLRSKVSSIGGSSSVNGGTNGAGSKRVLSESVTGEADDE